MKKIFLNSSLIVCFLVIITPYVVAQSFTFTNIFRSDRISDPGSFPEAENVESMVVSTGLTDIANPDDYLVRLTSINPGFIETYLSNYSEIGGGEYEFAAALKIPTPGSAWENYTYNFDIVDSNTKLIVYDSAQLFIPDGYVTDPLDTPSWYSFTGDLLNPTISWEPTFQSGAGLYRIIVYELYPDGYTRDSAVFRSQKFDTTTFILDDFTLVYGKSYDINIQSNLMNHDKIQKRLNFHVRYDTVEEFPWILFLPAIMGN